MKNPYNNITLKVLEDAIYKMVKKQEGKPREFIFYRIENGRVVVPGIMDQVKMIDEILSQ